jgi:putative ABC transport system permease protein
VALVPVELPAWLRFEIDGTVAVFALSLAALTTLLVGLAPAIRSSRPAIASALAASSARVAGGGDRVRAALIVAEVALAAVLLVGGGLMMRALAAVLANDPGVRPANVWTGRLAIPPAKYQTEDRQRAFFAETLDRVRALPGVRRASAVSSLPMAGSTSSRDVTIEGRPRAAANEELLAVICAALPEYFETVGIRLLRGRTFDARDGLPGTPPVAVVNEMFAKRYLPPGDPIGRRVSLGDGTGDDPWMTIVGVTADVRHEDLGAAPEAGLFLPYNQKPAAAMTLVVLAAASPLSLTEPIRRAVASIDRDRPLYAVRTLEQVMARSIWQSRLFAWLVGVFGAVALVLAAVGIFSVISCSVTERTRELGLRLALGAAPGQLRWLVLRQGLGVALIGLAVGLAGAAAVGRILGSWLHGVSPTDPATYAAVSLVLAGAAIAACLVPARRATRVNPAITLRGL